MRTYKVLTVRQPWAHLIIEGIKPVENRTWCTDYRGPLLIHAAKAYHTDRNIEALYDLEKDDLIRGAIIGIVDLIDIVTKHRSAFFDGPYGWVLSRPRRLRPVPLKGQLKLYDARVSLRAA